MDRPGDRFSVDPYSLPAPQSGVWTSNQSAGTGRPAGVLPQVPAGFEVTVFAEGLGRARWIEVAPNGDVLLSRPNNGDVLVLRDGDGDGRADSVSTLASGFSVPHGMAVGAGGLYVADVNAVWRVPYTPGDTAASGAPVALTPTGALGGTAGHTSRSLALSPDGTSLYVGIGSESNIAEESAPRATVLQFDSNGGNGRVLASGLRNPAGLEFDPRTGALYATVVERDGMGDNLVPDYVTRVQSGGFYGWPYAYIGPNAQPGITARPDLVAQTIIPDVLFEAHSTPIGLTFYSGNQFPAEYRDDMFVAMRGSWNASETRGFMVARVNIENGVPVNGYEAFMTGFVLSERAPVSVFGRPTTVAVAGNGSLLVGDDIGGTIYSVRYTGAPGANADANILTGAAGADNLMGLGGGDTLYGAGGADLLAGNAGRDLLYGNADRDTLFGGADDDTLYGGQGDDLLNGDNGSDRMMGDLGNDLLVGNAGADTLYGGRNEDTLYGGAGDDWLSGDLGNDWLSGDLGNDTLSGGAGADLFVFRSGGGADLVADFAFADGDRLAIGGRAWSVADGAAGAVLDFGSGDTVTLAGIAAGQVNQAWFAA
ncbi:PQQ-dependent sugar dehydrogenase [Azospirillum sp. SYSU D00513]|uniref:PQQ-dependent sugar dehydrogenase n=1 Tax=Azospirillum sp. SYSU D00513 TaxID=2812561 RepID=UPI001A968C44|nr:PQQ-dependent sugar dehydrogenase [Azospirillum sp. SYSU D00513]